MSCYLAEKEKADKFVVSLAALLHDVDDWKLNLNSAYSVDVPLTRTWLQQLNLEEILVDKICIIIQNISFKGANSEKCTLLDLEAKIVQDADRLDAIGAIGIARTFAYGGYKRRLMHNPDLEPTYHDTFESYKSHQGTTINHFYEKLLLLKDLMNTETAKKIAQNRHAFMEKFMKQFLNEWNMVD
jgi:uncharacterized protein